MADEFWARVGDGEMFQAGPWPTRSAALAEMRAEHGNNVAILIGRRMDVCLLDQLPDADDILELLDDRVGNELGEAWDGIDVTPDEKAELDVALTLLFTGWIKRFKLKIPSFNVVDIERDEPSTS